MNLSRERMLVGLLAAVLPLVLYGALLRPSFHRLGALHHRIQAAHGEVPEVRSFTALAPGERTLLEGAGASWGSRIPVVGDDEARLAQVFRVVTEVDGALRARGVRSAGMRTDWNPVAARFTLPAGFTPEPLPRENANDRPEYQLSGWILEVEISGGTDQLFRALSALPDVNSLVEPVGLRWEVTPGTDQAPGGFHQYLLLRDLYLKP